MGRIIAHLFFILSILLILLIRVKLFHTRTCTAVEDLCTLIVAQPSRLCPEPQPGRPGTAVLRGISPPFAVRPAKNILPLAFRRRDRAIGDRARRRCVVQTYLLAGPLEPPTANLIHRHAGCFCAATHGRRTARPTATGASWNHAGSMVATPPSGRCSTLVNNDSQQAAWRKTISVFDERSGESRELSLSPMTGQFPPTPSTPSRLCSRR